MRDREFTARTGLASFVWEPTPALPSPAPDFALEQNVTLRVVHARSVARSFARNDRRGEVRRQSRAHVTESSERLRFFHSFGLSFFTPTPLDNAFKSDQECYVIWFRV